MARDEQVSTQDTNALPDEDLQSLFSILKSKTGHDFSSYKRNTVLRRIDRRMIANEADDLQTYITILEKNPEEAQALYRELLIGVTAFFRDPEAFDVLRNRIIPSLFANKVNQESIRIWLTCCATGEEAYSVAMLVLEHLEKENLQTRVQIFATDIDESAVAQARAGFYSDDIQATIDAELLRKYFITADGRWQVTKQLREMIVFAHHSLIKDPPFSRLDLLVCRNFLIYLNPDIQRRLLLLFYQVLNPDGFLFLGTAETVGLDDELFTPIDKKWKIFSRQKGAHRFDTPFSFAAVPVRRVPGPGIAGCLSENNRLTPAAAAEKLLMERYVPARVIVNDQNEVIHFSSGAGSYLLTPEGEPTHDLLKMAKEDLRPTLRVAAYKAFADNKESAFRGIKMPLKDGETTVDIIAVPLAMPTMDERLALIIFEPGSPVKAPRLDGEKRENSGDSSDLLINQLEEQLRVTNEQLQATSEQLAAANDGFFLSNEQLMATNEELQSANEELQATNEELETSKEELQALNEELLTVNAELQEKIEEVNQSNSDLENLFTSSEIAVIFLDRKLAIKRFSAAMATFFNLLPADIGRPFLHLSGSVDLSGLPRDAETVLEKLTPVEREVSATENGRSFIMRVLPYRTTRNEIDGVVLILIDISQRKLMEAALRESEQQLMLFIDQAPASLAMFDTEMRYLRTSRRWFTDHNLVPGDLTGLCHYDVFPEISEEWREAHRRGLQGEVLRAESDRFQRDDGSVQWIRWEIQPWTTGAGQIGGIVIFTEDITEIKKAEDVLRRYELLVAQSRDIILFVQRDGGQILDANAAAVKAYGYNHAELLNLSIEDIRDPETIGPIPNQLAEADRQGILFETVHRRRDGSFFPVEVSSQGADLGGKRVLLSVVRDISERKAAEQAVQQAAELRRLALEAANLGAWEYDIITGQLTGDEMCQRLWNMPIEGRVDLNTAKSRVHPDDRQTVDEIIERALSGTDQGSFNHEFRILLPDGSERWIASSGRVYMSKDYDVPRPVRFAGVSRDITESKHSLAMQARLAAIVESSDDAIISKDLEGIILSWNTGAEKTFGYRADEMTGRPITVLIPPERQDEERLILERLAFGKRLKHYETLRLTKDGRKIDVSLTVSPIQDKNGEVIGISKIARDISQRKRDEEALRTTRTKLEAALASMTDAVFIADNAGQFIDFNDAFARFHRFENKAACYNKRADYADILEFTTIDGQTVPHEMWPVTRALRGETATNVEYNIRRRDIGESWVGSYSFSPIRNTEGDIAGAVTVARDITDLKHNEETRRTLEAQLKQVQKMEAIGQLAGGVAHDFNNMLGVILGHAELAMEGIEPNHPLYNNLNEISNAAQHSADITRQLLAFARKQMVTPKVIDLNMTVEVMLKMLRRLIGEDIDLVWRPGFDLWPVNIDPSQIDQILANLCVNARDAIAGIGTITVETENCVFDEQYSRTNVEIEPGDYVMLAVSDTGCGISQEMLTHIFEPFFTTKGVGEGTGLGLSTVYGAVRQNNGFINVYSDSGQGTTLKIYLPRHLEKKGSDGSTNAAQPAEGGRETILLVEDEPTILNMTAAMLKRLGYEVLTAGTPGEALRLAEQSDKRIHLLITDVIMPEMNGKELAERLLAVQQQIKCLFMSGYTANIITKQGILDKGVFFIQKPFSKKELADKVRASLVY